jgi:hypothetical protein
MEKNKQGGTKGRPVPDRGAFNKNGLNVGKGKHYYAPLQKIRSLLSNGGEFTARQLNELSQSNDARKCISVLRRAEYMPIRDIRIARGRKLYWLERDPKGKEAQDEH